MAWVRAVCGRLKSGYRYSKDIVYNNFPWPENVTDAQRAQIETPRPGRPRCPRPLPGQLPRRPLRSPRHAEGARRRPPQTRPRRRPPLPAQTVRDRRRPRRVALQAVPGAHGGLNVSSISIVGELVHHSNTVFQRYGCVVRNGSNRLNKTTSWKPSFDPAITAFLEPHPKAFRMFWARKGSCRATARNSMKSGSSLKNIAKHQF